MNKEEAIRQSKMTHKELFILNGQKAAIRSLIFVFILYVFFRFIFGIKYEGIFLACWFLLDASCNTFKCKWFKFLIKDQ